MRSFTTPRSDFGRLLKEAGKFLCGEGDAHDTLRRIASRLGEAAIDYATIGEMALFAHGYRRYTEKPIEILTTPEGLLAVEQQIVGDDFISQSRKALRDTKTAVTIEFVTTDESAGLRSVNIDGVQIITIEKLVEMKLASGLSNPNVRLRDLADVQDLIKHVNLPLDLAEKLDPSVRNTYIQYWHAHQNATGPDRE